MSRLTEKIHSLKYVPSNEKLVSVEEIIYKLGKLEDLLEKYNINSVKKLETLIKGYQKIEKENLELNIDLGACQKENEMLTKDIEKYWQLQEKVGCDLEVMFKALEEGIVINEKGYVNSAYADKEFNAEVDSHYDCLTLSKVGNNYYFEDINHPYGDPECGDIGCCVRLSNYHKNWWLKGEKNC